MPVDSTERDCADLPSKTQLSNGPTDGDETPVRAVVEAVAEANGTDPLDLPPMYDAIDPDALNALFTSRPGASHVRVTFRYAGCEVVVTGRDEIRVDVTA